MQRFVEIHKVCATADRKKASGFTLIELMIVVTIIGVLGSMAIPVYRDYTIKTKTLPSTFAPIKTAISLYVSENGDFPEGLAVLNGVSSAPTDYATTYIEQISVSNENVTVTYQTLSELGDASGTTLVYTASLDGSTVDWSISEDDSTLPKKYWH